MPSSRTGTYVRQPGGYRAFIPAPFPPEPELALTTNLIALASRAAITLGRLDGVVTVLPNPRLFVASFVRKEALLSSQIEGTEASLEDVFAPESPPERTEDVSEVVNYVAALEQGLERLRSLPTSLRLIREIHARLMQGVRGGNKTPGEFRTSQNWIGGAAGKSLEHATYVPPPPSDMHSALGAWERYMVAEPHAPELIKCGLLHAQFETIHPFLDGNGRLGRLLITFLLHQWGVLRQPTLYLSLWFKQHRADYYAHLQAVRDEGAWEAWIEFFLEGIAQTADGATRVALEVLELRDKDAARIGQATRSSNALPLLDQLFETPMVNVSQVEARLDVSQPTAKDLVDRFVQLGILHEVTGRRWGRVFRYDAYFRLLSRDQ